MNFQADLFFEQDEGSPIHFERTWNHLPSVGDTVAVEDRDETTGESDFHIGIVARRGWLSDTPQSLRIQLTIVPDKTPIQVLLAGETGESDSEPDTI